MNIRREIRGFVRVEGDEKSLLRLMNICAHKNIRTWGNEPKRNNSNVHQRNSGNAYLYIYLDDAESVRHIAENCSMDLEINEQMSIRKRLRDNKRKLPILLGIFAFLICVYIESLYIWRIDVSGCGDYTEDEVIDIIDNYYPCLGKKKKNIDADKLEKIISDRLEKVCWVSCSIRGTKLTVHLSESVDVFTDHTSDRACNLVATMDCTVYSIVTSAGTPLVKAGDEIKKGDQLISGTVNICNDDSEVVDTKYVPAQGIIIGQCKIPYRDEVKYEYYKKSVIDSDLDSVRIITGKKIINIYSSDKKIKNNKENKDVSLNFDQEQSDYWLHIGDFYLPAGVQISRCDHLDVECKRRPESEAKKLAEQHIVTYIGKLKEKGVQIVQKNVIITSRSDSVIAEGELVVRMPVGIPEF